MALAAVRSKAVVLVLLIRCWLLLTLWYFVIVLCFVVRYFVSILVFNHLDGEDRAVTLLYMSSRCLAIVVWFFLTLPRVCLQFVIVIFPDHTHLLFLLRNPDSRMTFACSSGLVCELRR